MARGYPGILYPIPAFPQVHVDVERMSRDSLRRYLRHRLRSLDAQIRVVAREHEARTQELGYNPASMGEVWDGILEIDYLQTMRDAIAETLAAL